MKEVKFYECEFCDSIFKDFDEACECEDSHSQPMEYKLIFNAGKKYPRTVLIEFDNGAVGAYSLDEIYEDDER